MRRISLAILIASVQSHVAVAQEFGRNRPATIDGTDVTAARRANKQFGNCIVRVMRPAAQEFVATPVGSPRYAQLMNRLLDADCLANGAFRSPEPIWRASIFEGLYVRRFFSVGPVQFEGVKPLDYRSGYTSSITADVAGMIALGEMGDCVVRADGTDAKNLILSTPATLAEDEAIARLATRLGGCVPKGQRIGFSRSIIRAAVAEALYRLSVAAAVL